MTEGEERGLWSQARVHGDAGARIALIDHYTDVARMIAARYYRTRSDDDVEFRDYLQYAMVGLIESVDRYDPDNEASFSTFAGYRIRGAVLNGLEKATERREQAAFRRRHARDRLESIAAAGGDADADPFEQMVSVTVELALSYMLEDSGILERGDETDDRVFERHAVRELYNHLGQIVDRLPERERFIVRNHYFHDVPFEELARLLDVSKGRVSQLHKRALGMMKGEYEKGLGLDALF